MSRISWPGVLAHAADIVQSYDTGVTLRPAVLTPR
jgi:hypothetical protein